MTSQLTIGDLIDVPPVKTVIRLEEGREHSEEIAKSFVFTSEVSAHLNVITEALMAGRGQGYFLQGDFGSGKSHLLAMLYTWLSGLSGTEHLISAHPGMERTSGSNRRTLPVAVSLIDYRSSTPLEQILLEAVEKALAEKGRTTALSPVSVFLDRVRNMLEDHDTAEVFTGLTGAPGDRLSEWISENPGEAYTGGIKLFQKLGAETPGALVEERSETFHRMFRELDDAGFDGIFLLIDELSEFFRSKPSARSLNEDARTLQLLGELTGARPLWIVAAVQESIEATGDIAHSILRKIKDRFPVRLSLSTVHIRSLISERLVRKKPGAGEEIYRIYEHYRGQFPTFTCSFDEFQAIYPVHPATIALLDGLGGLFSQHRGIVDFVCARIAGDPSRNIPSILNRPDQELLGPDSIFEHFAERLAEFSSYNIYPRHIVPHLDMEIDKVLDNGEDRYLAKRLIRMLVLYRIHPTAVTPGAAMLAELASCSFDAPEMNALFVSEALLDPLARSSRFLTKKEDGEPDSRVYEITTEEDPGKVLDAWINRIEDGLDPKDSRLLLEPLSQIPESDSWPGPVLSPGGVVRQINWNFSQRRVLVRYMHRDEAPQALHHRGGEQEECDFSLFLTLEEGKAPAGHPAIWQVPFPKQSDTMEPLKEYLAVRLALIELSPSNPAQAPLIPAARDRLNRLKPAACQAALDTFYAGSFSDPRIRLDAAIRQLKRFDRLLEAAGEVVLADKYPRFAEVAPRRFLPSPRIYQQLLESFIIPGSLSLREARARSLSAPIDGLAVPLGLVELKRGSYLYSPDVSGHPLLSFLFQQISPSGTVPLKELLEKCKKGVFGLPKDTSLFLLASLAAGGLITIRKNGKALALDYLSLQNLERAEEVTLGELIGEYDRTTLLKECGFLDTSGGWESFGLRQQRNAWQEVVRFRDTAERLAGETLADLQKRHEYSSFRNFGFEALEEKLAAVGRIGREIRVSYTAKEGLEKFLNAWRSEGLRGEDIPFLLKLERFLNRGAEKFVFINHYVRHEGLTKIDRFEQDLAVRRKIILEMLEKPEQDVVPDEGNILDREFAQLRELYIPLYTKLHGEYYDSRRQPELSKNAERALQTLRRLAGIEAMDRPPGLDRFLTDMDNRQTVQCRRQTREELMRSPLCSCGFLPGQGGSFSAPKDPGKEIDRFLTEYVAILNTPGVLEPISAHAYAIQDMLPEVSKHLKKLGAGLESGSIRSSSLVSVLDEATIRELSRAIEGTVTLKRVNLDDLTKRLAGRRLPPARVLSLFAEWLGVHDDDTLVAVVGKNSPGQAEETGAADWWPLANARYFPHISTGDRDEAALTGKLGTLLEQRYPSGQLVEHFKRMNPETLIRYIRGEPFHTSAIRTAWLVLAERVLEGAAFPEEKDLGCSHADLTCSKETEKRLVLIGEIAGHLGRAYPERLAVRLDLETLFSDPWAKDALKTCVDRTLEKTQSLGGTWLEGLDPVKPIRLEERPLVLLIDGVPPDIWLKVLPRITTKESRPFISWSRLTTVPETAAATALLFGVEEEPADALSALGVPYITLSGTGDKSVSAELEGLASGTAAVVRLSVLDRGAHRGAYKLSEIVLVLETILDRELLPILKLCRRQNRPLVLTTDHGMSLRPGRMDHGRGGVYESAIFRAVWNI